MAVARRASEAASELAREMEAYVLEILLRHAQHITRVSEEHIAPLTVFRHILIFALLERLELAFVIAFHPARLVQMHWFPTTTSTILVLQAVLYDLKLQLSHRADNLSAVELVDKQLRNTLVHKLVDAFLQLLRLHWVVVFDVFEHLGRERWQSTEMELLTVCERVANLEDAVVGQSDNVAGPRFFYR